MRLNRRKHAPEHGESQFGVGKRLEQLLPAGHVITERPLSTREGVKLVDVAWSSEGRGLQTSRALTSILL